MVTKQTNRSYTKMPVQQYQDE